MTGALHLRVKTRISNLFSVEAKKARRNLFNTHTSRKPSASEDADKQTASPRKKRRHASARKSESKFAGSLFLCSVGREWESRATKKKKFGWGFVYGCFLQLFPRVTFKEHFAKFRYIL